MTLSTSTIGIMGCGNMGTSMIQGLLKNDAPKKILINDHHATKQLSHDKIQWLEDKKTLVLQSDVIILAVKPQSMNELYQELAGASFTKKRPIILSIAAGITLAHIQKGLQLEPNYPLIRAMPNTPALIQAGISGLFGPTLSAEDKTLTEAIMSAIGSFVWVHEEGHIDIVTALSGSGPAYFFYMLEHLIKGAVDLGLSEDVAKQLAVQTGLGAMQMVQQSQLSLADLRLQVTSKGGTTEAALNYMSQNHLDILLQKSVLAAFERAQELQRS